MNEFEGKYLTISQALIAKEGLSIFQKLLLAQIHQLDNDKGCFASDSYLCRFFGIGKRWLRRQLNVLKEKGFIESRNKYVEGKNAIEFRILKVTEKGVKFLASYPQEGRGQSFQEVGVNRSDTGGSIVPEGEGQSFQEVGVNRPPIKEKEKIKEENKERENTHAENQKEEFSKDDLPAYFKSEESEKEKSSAQKEKEIPDLEEMIIQKIIAANRQRQEAWVRNYSIDIDEIPELARNYSLDWIGKQNCSEQQMALFIKKKPKVAFQSLFESHYLKNAWKYREEKRFVSTKTPTPAPVNQRSW